MAYVHNAATCFECKCDVPVRFCMNGHESHNRGDCPVCGDVAGLLHNPKEDNVNPLIGTTWQHKRRNLTGIIRNALYSQEERALTVCLVNREGTFWLRLSELHADWKQTR